MSTQAAMSKFDEPTEPAEPKRDYSDPGDGLIIEIVGRRYTDEGVKLLKENNAGGVWSCSWEVIEWGTKEDIKQCPSCGEFHNAHNPPLCHSCTFGVGK